MQIIAHRGASYDAPENTLGSINLAWQQGADGVEIDVRLTRDDRIVVIHDATTGRTAGRRWKVAERTLEDLQTLDASRHSDVVWRGERIPSLEQVLQTVPQGRRLFVEIKCGQGILPELERVCRACGKTPQQLAVISFDRAVVEAVKSRLPRVLVYWLRDTRLRQEKRRPWAQRFDDWIEICRRAGVNGLDVASRCKIRPETLHSIHRAGLELYVWTVNSPRTARKLASLGVDGITTDRPGWIRRQLERSAS